jgi:hypothetical protein
LLNRYQTNSVSDREFVAHLSKAKYPVSNRALSNEVLRRDEQAIRVLMNQLGESREVVESMVAETRQFVLQQ